MDLNFMDNDIGMITGNTRSNVFDLNDMSTFDFYDNGVSNAKKLR